MARSGHHLPLTPAAPMAPQTERAEATAALFTRDGEQTNNLFDMQARTAARAPARLCMLCLCGCKLLPLHLIPFRCMRVCEKRRTLSSGSRCTGALPALAPCRPCGTRLPAGAPTLRSSSMARCGAWEPRRARGAHAPAAAGALPDALHSAPPRHLRAARAGSAPPIVRPGANTPS